MYLFCLIIHSFIYFPYWLSSPDSKFAVTQIQTTPDTFSTFNRPTYCTAWNDATWVVRFCFPRSEPQARNSNTLCQPRQNRSTKTGPWTPESATSLPKKGPNENKTSNTASLCMLSRSRGSQRGWSQCQLPLGERWDTLWTGHQSIM